MSVVLDFVRRSMPMGWESTPSGWTKGNCPMCVQNGENADTRKQWRLLCLKKTSFVTTVSTVALLQVGAKADKLVAD